MSKCDDDNRSNQLNPNNAAYHSSRGNGGRDDEDEDDDGYGYGYSCSRSLADSLAEDRAQREQQFMAEPVYERFTLDFLALDGRKSYLEVTAKLPRRSFRTNSISDCTDIFELFAPFIKNLFKEEVRVPIAFFQVRNGKGEVLGWMGDEYRPKIPMHNEKSEQKAIRIQHLEMWENSGKILVEEFKKAVSLSNTLTRESLGEISVDGSGRLLKYPPAI